MNKSELVAIRDMSPEDKNFILATWLRGLYYGESHLSEMSKDAFMTQFHKILNWVLIREDISIKVACLRDDPGVILGYSVASKHSPVIHWCFVKKAWRSIGIAKSLLPEGVKTATNLTKSGLSIMKKKGINYNPFPMYQIDNRSQK